MPSMNVRIGVPLVRVLLNNDWFELPVTAAGISFSYATPVSVTVSPADAPDYSVTTSRQVRLEFSVPQESLIEIARSISGFVQYTTGGASYQQAVKSIWSQPPFGGPTSLQIVLPPDANGNTETRTYEHASIAIEQSAFSESWSLNSASPVKLTALCTTGPVWFNDGPQFDPEHNDIYGPAEEVWEMVEEDYAA